MIINWKHQHHPKTMLRFHHSSWLDEFFPRYIQTNIYLSLGIWSHDIGRHVTCGHVITCQSGDGHVTYIIWYTWQVEGQLKWEADESDIQMDRTSKDKVREYIFTLNGESIYMPWFIVSLRQTMATKRWKRVDYNTEKKYNWCAIEQHTWTDCQCQKEWSKIVKSQRSYSSHWFWKWTHFHTLMRCHT